MDADVGPKRTSGRYQLGSAIETIANIRLKKKCATPATAAMKCGTGWWPNATAGNKGFELIGYAPLEEIYVGCAIRRMAGGGVSASKAGHTTVTQSNKVNSAKSQPGLLHP
jgi:hypothetical protein